MSQELERRSNRNIPIIGGIWGRTKAKIKNAVYEAGMKQLGKGAVMLDGVFDKSMNAIFESGAVKYEDGETAIAQVMIIHEKGASEVRKTQSMYALKNLTLENIDAFVADFKEKAAAYEAKYPEQTYTLFLINRKVLKELSQDYTKEVEKIKKRGTIVLNPELEQDIKKGITEVNNDIEKTILGGGNNQKLLR